MESENSEQFTVEALAPLSKKRRLLKIEELLRKLLSRLLEVDEAIIKNDTSFFEIGMVSLTAEQFTKELQDILGDKYPISATTTFNYSTIELLSTHIEKTLFPT